MERSRRRKRDSHHRMVVKVKRNLPIDIESNILSRLPVKTVLRFRSVQKSWYSLVSDPFFMDMHLSHHQSNNNKNKDDNLHLMQYYYRNNHDIVVANTSSNVLSIFKRKRTYKYDLVGSSNGLVCVYGFNDNISSHGNKDYVMEYIGLWNPALRINKIIRHKRIRMSMNDVCVGFGFHKQTNDYKVIRFTNEISTGRLKEVEIYSLSSDSWRNIEVVDSWSNFEVVALWSMPYSCGLNVGVYVSDAALIPNFCGAYCWLAMTFKNDERHEDMIISFDMGDEVFKQMMLPPISKIGDASLFNYKDSLAVLEMRHNNLSLSLCHVWVMKEYNEPTSWTNMCKLDAPCTYMDAMFVGIILETELILIAKKHGSDKEELCVFDIENSQTNTSSTKDICILTKAEYVSSFTESLVLLDTNNKRKRSRSN